jgi:hypothetical protein
MGLTRKVKHGQKKANNGCELERVKHGQKKANNGCELERDAYIREVGNGKARKDRKRKPQETRRSLKPPLSLIS